MSENKNIEGMESLEDIAGGNCRQEMLPIDDNRLFDALESVNKGDRISVLSYLQNPGSRHTYQIFYNDPTVQEYLQRVNLKEEARKALDRSRDYSNLPSSKI